MKKITFFFILVYFTCNINGFCQNSTNSGDVILGKWYTEDDKSIVEVYKKDNKYYGKIIWLKTPNNEQGKPKTDIHNPDPKLQSRPEIGLEILVGLVYEGDNVWDDAEIYDPECGKTYSCKASLEDANTLNIRGYIGFSLIGRTTEWRRQK